MISGRRRKYFGYSKDLKGIFTPDSAKSYASFISTSKNKDTCNLRSTEQQSMKPNKQLPHKFADKSLHAKIEAEIPSLLPPLRNTHRFREFQQNPMKFHTPHLEHHYERSLYYIWLSKNDREELCDIVDAHLGFRNQKFKELAHLQKLPPMDYSNMPRRLSVLEDTERPGPSKPQKQKNGWDNPRTPKERFFRDHNKSKAMSAILREYPGNSSKVTEKDIQDCLLAAKRLLGPYDGIRTHFTYLEDVPPWILDKLALEDEQQKERLREVPQEAPAKRPFGYLSSQVDYEKKIASAVEYYNKIKLGIRNPTPPRELYSNVKKNLPKASQQPRRPDGMSSIYSITSQSEARREKDKNRKKKKFDKRNVTEEDYMNFYLHFLGDKDIGEKKGVKSLTDVSKLRKKLHLDPNPEDLDEDIAELLRTDSLSDIRDPIARKIIRGDMDPFTSTKDHLSEVDAAILKAIMDEHHDRLPEMPKVKASENKARFKRMKLFKKRQSDDNASKRPSKVASDISNPNELTEEQMEELHDLELSLGYTDQQRVGQETLSTFNWTDEESLESTGASTESEQDLEEAKGVNMEFIAKCHGDLQCLSEKGLLGPRPFVTRSKGQIIASDESLAVDNEEKNIFSKEHWIKKREDNLLAENVKLKGQKCNFNFDDPNKENQDGD